MQEQFVIDYIAQHGSVNVLDGDFHDQFHAKFGGARDRYGYNAPVKKAMRLIRKMYRNGKLKRYTLGIAETTGTGLPKWVYDYSLE